MKKVKVGINLLSLRPQNIGGVKTYIEKLIEELVKIKEIEVIPFGWKSIIDLLKNNIDFREIEIFDMEYSHYRRVVSENFVFSSRIKRKKIDVMFAPFSIGSPFLSLKIPQVVTVHDLQHMDQPNNFCWATRQWRNIMIGGSIERSSEIIAISNYTKTRITAYYPEKKKRVHTVYEGVDEIEKPSEKEKKIAKQKYGIRGKYFIYPAMMAKHKNHRFLIKVFKIFIEKQKDLKIQLIFTGKMENRGREIMEEVRTLGLDERIRHIGYVTRKDVISLIGGSSALLFPSLYEGFGLPILEAQIMGTPVICAKAGSIPEIAGKDAAVIPVNSVDIWIKEMTHAIDDEKWKKKIYVSGIENAKKYSWKKCAEGTAEVLRMAYER